MSVEQLGSEVVLAPAKINMHLHVTDLLPDGRHALDTSFVFVDAFDTLHVQLSGELAVGCSVAALSGEKNLVFQVLHALRERYGVTEGLQVWIDKMLPDQAGLGGGSSDAASALMVANRLWKLDLTMSELIAFAVPFGADIPCFLYGRASLAQGVGEKLTPYPTDFPQGCVCLARPDSGLSTRDVFIHFDLLQESLLTKGSPLAKVRPASQGYVPVGSNDLEPSAIELLPVIASILQVMRSHDRIAWMSGSGSTCVALCSSEEDAKSLSSLLKETGLVRWTHAGKLLKRHPAFAASYIGA